MTVTQAKDFEAESDALYDLIADLDDSGLKQPTAFKGWTAENVIGHLHVWNIAADMALSDPEGFRHFFKQVADALRTGSLRRFEEKWLSDKGLSGKELVGEWRDFYRAMAERFYQADPSARVEWAGPSMSVRSSATARLMETWAHAQEIYDLLGVERENADRIENIVILGNNTYGWTFKVNGLEAPEPRPHLVLTAPSGNIWHFNVPSNDHRIEGPASEFCQVVTQTRNIADTSLEVTGENATRWMAMAQCFAGKPETPPAPGARKRLAPS